MVDLMHDQILVFLTMALAFGIGWFFIDREGHIRKPAWPTTRKDRATGLIKFYPSSVYSHFRNPMRTLRRFAGWPGGRQWVKLRKFWNREYPQGAKRLAGVLSAAAAGRVTTVDPRTAPKHHLNHHL